MNKYLQSEFSEFIREENQIKKELKIQGNINKGFKKYLLLNKDWVDKFKKLYNDKNYKSLLDIKSINKKNEDKDYTYIKRHFSFSLPTNFTLGTEMFISLLSRYLKTNDQIRLQKVVFDIIIGGQCLIMKDFKQKSNYTFVYITLYNEEKEDFSHEIDFFIYIKDNEFMKKTLNLILTTNIWNFFKEIKYNYKEEFKIFKSSRGNKDGYIVRNNSIENIDEIYRSLKNIGVKKPKGENIEHDESEINNSLNNIKANIIEINKLNSILFCIYQIKEQLFGYLINSNKNKNLQLSKLLISFYEYYKTKSKYNNKISEDISNILNLNNNNDYKSIISKILEKLDNEHFTGEKYNFEDDQVNMYDEKKILKIFEEQHKKISIINKLFFIAKEKIKDCSECSMTSYAFNYIKYILIELDKEVKEIKLENKLLSILEEKREEKCLMCSGKKTNSKIKEKVVIYPEILIVIIEGKKFKYFSFTNNIYIFKNNNKDILYSLKCFIENDTNEVYFRNKDEWFKYLENNMIENSNDNLQKYPVVLFYKLYDENYNNIINYDKNNNMQIDENVKNIQNNIIYNNKSNNNNKNINLNIHTMNNNQNNNINNNVIINNNNIPQNNNHQNITNNINANNIPNINYLNNNMNGMNINNKYLNNVNANNNMVFNNMNLNNNMNVK